MRIRVVLPHCFPVLVSLASFKDTADVLCTLLSVSVGVMRLFPSIYNFVSGPCVFLSPSAPIQTPVYARYVQMNAPERICEMFLPTGERLHEENSSRAAILVATPMVRCTGAHQKNPSSWLRPDVVTLVVTGSCLPLYRIDVASSI
jgi:hypothetical protein